MAGSRSGPRPTQPLHVAPSRGAFFFNAAGPNRRETRADGLVYELTKRRVSIRRSCCSCKKVKPPAAECLMGLENS